MPSPWCGRPWTLVTNQRPCVVRPARVQGISANIEHFVLRACPGKWHSDHVPRVFHGRTAGRFGRCCEETLQLCGVHTVFAEAESAIPCLTASGGPAARPRCRTPLTVWISQRYRLGQHAWRRVGNVWGAGLCKFLLVQTVPRLCETFSKMKRAHRHLSSVDGAQEPPWPDHVVSLCAPVIDSASDEEKGFNGSRFCCFALMPAMWPPTIEEELPSGDCLSLACDCSSGDDTVEQSATHVGTGCAKERYHISKCPPQGTLHFSTTRRDQPNSAAHVVDDTLHAHTHTHEKCDLLCLHRIRSQWPLETSSLQSVFERNCEIRNFTVGVQQNRLRLRGFFSTVFPCDS